MLISQNIKKEIFITPCISSTLASIINGTEKKLNETIINGRVKRLNDTIGIW